MSQYSTRRRKIIRLHCLVERTFVNEDLCRCGPSSMQTLVYSKQTCLLIWAWNKHVLMHFSSIGFTARGHSYTVNKLIENVPLYAVFWGEFKSAFRFALALLGTTLWGFCSGSFRSRVTGLPLPLASCLPLAFPLPGATPYSLEPPAVAPGSKGWLLLETPDSGTASLSIIISQGSDNVRWALENTGNLSAWPLAEAVTTLDELGSTLVISQGERGGSRQGESKGKARGKGKAEPNFIML